jgi:hypothetical protein
MKFTRLILNDKPLTRQDFLNQPRKLFVLPDNLPDFRLLRNKLHDTKNRSGLAEVMRPNKIGGTDTHPVYDVNVVGVPTLSFESAEGLSVKHIVEAFSNIYRLLKTDEFDEIVVPYKGGVPAFGGGVAGNIPSIIKNTIEEEFKRLEQFLNTNVTPKDFPEDYRKAIDEGPLPIKATLRQRITTYLNDRFPRLSIFIQAILALGATWGVYAAVGTLLAPIALGITITAVAALTVVAYQLCMNGIFGHQSQTFQLNKEGQAVPKTNFQSASIQRGLGFNVPYKRTLAEVETELKKSLSEFFKKPDDQTASSYEEEIATLTKYNAKNCILNAGDAYFYETDIARVKTKDYDVDAQVAEYKRRRKI